MDKSAKLRITKNAWAKYRMNKSGSAIWILQSSITSSLEHSASYNFIKMCCAHLKWYSHIVAHLMLACLCTSAALEYTERVILAKGQSRILQKQSNVQCWIAHCSRHCEPLSLPRGTDYCCNWMHIQLSNKELCFLLLSSSKWGAVYSVKYHWKMTTKPSEWVFPTETSETAKASYW